MAECEDNQSSSGEQANSKEAPPRHRIVMPKRFNPRQRLEEKMRQCALKESGAAQTAFEQTRPVPPMPGPRDRRALFVPRLSPVREKFPPPKPPRRGLSMKKNVLTTSVLQTADRTVGEHSSRTCCSELPSTSVQAGDSLADHSHCTVPPHSARIEPMVKLDDVTTLQPDTSRQNSREAPQPPVQKTKLIKKPVLIRWPYAFTDDDPQTRSPKDTPEHPQYAKNVDSEVKTPEHFHVPASRTPEKKARAEKPLIPVEPRADMNRPRYWSVVEPLDYYKSTYNEDLRLFQQKVAPTKPLRKRLPKPAAPVPAPVPAPTLDAEKKDQLCGHGEAVGEVPPYLLPSKQKEEMPIDAFCSSFHVLRLREDNYRDFLRDKIAAMVMFYKPWDSSCVKGRRHFVKAAECTHQPGSAYAAVDCSIEENLCVKEGITSVPTYKVYSRGMRINTVKDFIYFNDCSMKKLMERAPEFTEPDVNRSYSQPQQSFVKKVFQKLKI